MKQLLEFSGIEPERLVLKWVSSAEGPRFAQVVTDFVEKIRSPGAVPSGRHPQWTNRYGLDRGYEQEPEHPNINYG